MKLPCALLLPLALLAAAAPVAGETGPWVQNLHPSASATATWVDNVSRTSDPATRKDAMTYELHFGVVQPRQVARNWLLDLGATADLLAEPKFDRNNWLSAGPRAGLQHKFGLGPLAPVLRFDTALAYKTARLQANSGWTAEAGVRASKRLNESFRVSAGWQWLEHYAKQATFDISQRTVSVEATWDISERWRLTASAGRLSGRIVAHAAGGIWAAAQAGALGPVIASYYNSIPSLVTHSYGPNWVSYNVAAHADLWSVAAACELTDRTTLELRVGSVFVVNRVQVRYPTESWGLSLIHRF